MSDPVTLNYPVNKTLSADTVSNTLTNGDDVVVVADIVGIEGAVPEENGDGNIQFGLVEGLKLYVFPENVTEYDTTDVTKELNYDGITIYVWAYEESAPEAGDAYTEYCFFEKNTDDTIYYMCSIGRDGYYTHESDTDLPESLAQYIDALTVYMDGEAAELSDAPEE